ncbi:MAG: PEP-CTERM sorting domain-containing protein [Verrucomicrobiota bacterium JB023]|nr:PEP-CTERM sorting domain-containing protein [Verrucomicrobiota bacterium JB023]
MKIRTALLLSTTLAVAGPYAPKAGTEGSTAIALDDSRIVAWATEVSSYQPGLEVDEAWQDESRALGPAEGQSGTIVSLGRGGEIVLSFAQPIGDGPGPDFAVFENSFSDSFLELAFVEVSADGSNFVRFPNDSLTASAVPAFGVNDPTNVTGLAGKYRGGYGVPFDLAEVGLASVQYVRLVDVVGGTSLDSSGDVIYDPYPTVGSAGFDLDGVGVLNEDMEEIKILSVDVVNGQFQLTWSAVASVTYVVEEYDATNGEWANLTTLVADEETASFTTEMAAKKQRLVRVKVSAES